MKTKSGHWSLVIGHQRLRRLTGAGGVHNLPGSYCRSVKDPKVVPIETTNIKQAIVILLWR